jgi:hypothetical protein
MNNNFLIKYSISSEGHTAEGYLSLQAESIDYAWNKADTIAYEESNGTVAFGDQQYVNFPNEELMVINEVTPISMTNLKVLQKFSIV